MKPSQVTTELGDAEAELARALLALRRTPSPALEQRVQAIPCLTAPPRRIRARLAWAAVALVLALALLLASPAARATLGEVEAIVGRIYLTITDALPTFSDGETIIEGERMSVEQARAAVPFDWALPTWLPAGFAPAEEAEVYRPNDEVGQVVQLQWRDAGDNLLELSLHAQPEGQPIHLIVGPDSVERVLVNGQAAALVRGGWDNPSGEWRYQDQTVTLAWVVDGVQYNLLAYGGQVSLTELIAIAESIR